MSSGRDLILYQFSRQKVERGDFRGFLELYGRDKLPSGGRLRRMAGCFLFAVEGYDHDSREIYAIPEVRAFYQALWKAWPYWLFFCCLIENDVLKPMTLCCLDGLEAVQVDGQPRSAATLDMSALKEFVREGFCRLDEIAARAEMFPDRVEARKNEVLRFYGLEDEIRIGPISG